MVVKICWMDFRDSVEACRVCSGPSQNVLIAFGRQVSYLEAYLHVVCRSQF